MKIRNARAMVLVLGLFLFLILISIGYLTTNETSRLIVIPIRLIAIFGVVSSLAVLLFINRVKAQQLLASILYLSFVLYGATMSMLNGAFDIGEQNLLVNTVVTLSGLTLMTMSDDRSLFDSLAKPYFLYAILGLIATIVVGGLKLSPLPHFVLEYNADFQSEAVLLYSQGISKFFGLASISSVYLMSKVKGRFYICALFFITFVFLGLSLLGGARGDSAVAIIVVFGFLALKFRFIFLLLLILMSSSLYLYVGEWGALLGDFLIFQRFAAIVDGHLGHRDILLSQVLSLLSNEPRCLIIGCGFGYFQTYYGTEFGWYPHNFIAESLIVFGVPISAVFGFFVVGSVKTYCKNNGNEVDFFMLLFFYAALIQMKSGVLFGGWFFTAFSIYLVSMYFPRLTQTRSILLTN